MEKRIQDILKDQAIWDVWKEMPADSKEKYQAYLCSRDWAILRNKVMERCGGICERCNINKADAVHHLHYATKYRESPDDLRAFCDGCHKYTHGKSDVDPRLEGIKGITEIPLSDCLQQDATWSSLACSQVRCPICQDTYVHFEFPVARDGQDSYKAWHGRGNAIVVPCWCESGHQWEIVFGFHKGNTYAFCQSFGMKEGYSDA